MSASVCPVLRVGLTGGIGSGKSAVADRLRQHGAAVTDADPASDTLRGTGASLTFDYAAYFVRVANDPYVNFTNNHMVRLAAGMRF